jgi:opacity protein-like surface antigen
MNKTFKSLMLTGAALAVLGGNALAADFIPTPEPAGGFYAGVFGGATWFTDNGADFGLDDLAVRSIIFRMVQIPVGHPDCHPDASGDISLDTDTGFLVGGVLGYNWGDTGLRSELELSYSQANLDGFDIDWDGATQRSASAPSSCNFPMVTISTSTATSPSPTSSATSGTVSAT